MPQVTDTKTRYAFNVEWLDPGSQVVWRYLLSYHVEAGEVELYDIKNKRIFLRRTKCDTISESKLYLGSVVTVFSRQLKVRCRQLDAGQGFGGPPRAIGPSPGSRADAVAPLLNPGA